MDILSRFHPVIARWFQEKFGEPTEVQMQSWQHISSGQHALITAPTGSGKTLAAFLWAINQLVTGKLETGHTSILYISPLKALNNDIQRNLLRPLAEIKEKFAEAGLDWPDIRVETRSGDTPQAERVRILRHPPEIFITTPESLNLMLSSLNGRLMLKSLSVVILDEVHAVLGTKRGVYLMTAIERLVPLSGEFQRIAISATIKPIEPAARFIGGFRLEGDLKYPTYVPRTVELAPSRTVRQYDLQVRFPGPEIRGEKEPLWAALANEFKEIIQRNRSTLIFANSRRLCEKLALEINDGAKEPVIYVHHGSLSREVRNEVERKLREGELKAVIATNSLELGIDIGDLDEVILVQAPFSISSAIQRVGRAKHQVGQVCKGTIYPAHPYDLLDAAVLAPAITSQNIEAIKPIICPLDVLAQVIVSMVGVESWDIDMLFAQLKASYTYNSLSRPQFDLVLNMLAGRYADSQIRELRPQVSIDRLDNTVAARKGALLSIYTSGGVIPDRGYFHLRHKETNALLGELDEEFVWEADIGKTFSLGAQNWKIERITHNDVFVVPGHRGAMETPFWRAEENYRDFRFSELIGEFLELANGRLENQDFVDYLQRNHYMDEGSAEELIDFLKRQRESTGSDLPHRHHVLLEFVNTGPGGLPGNQLVIHTVWGNRVNRPLAMALDAAWEKRFKQKLEVYTSNHCIVFQLPPEIRAEQVMSMVTSATVESLLRKRLESSGFFGARFRECAGRALLLPRNRGNKRMPLWMTRLRSQKLLNAISKYEDFPILLETWRDCLVDEFDLENLKQILAEVESGAIRWSEVHTSFLSPMAQHITWQQTNQYMYMSDEPPGGLKSSLSDELLREVVFTPGLRPTIAPDIIAQFEQKRRRLASGYSPEDARDLVDWVKERLLIPASEWGQLLLCIQKDHAVDPDELLKSISGKLVKIQPPAAAGPLVVALENLGRITYGLYGTTEIPVRSLLPLEIRPVLSNEIKAVPEGDRDEILISILGEWLQYFGPMGQASIGAMLGIDGPTLSLALEDLIDSQDIISGQLVTGADGEQVCDSENFEALLRLQRRAAVPQFKAKKIEYLPLFLAYYQGLGEPAGDVESLFRHLEQLRCLPAAAELWESEILPARLNSYSISWLDSVMQEGNLRWIGAEKQVTAFCFDEDLALLQGDNGTAAVPEEQNPPVKIFPDTRGHYDFSTLLTATGFRPNELSERLWEGVWQGRITNDTYTALRKGIMTHFAAPETVLQQGQRYGHRPGRISFSSWKASLPFAGNWFQLPPAPPFEDILEGEERLKDRVRVLLDRYGILFRELLDREAPLFHWGKIFRALRLMELSGEVLAGYFFQDIPGPQFMTTQSFQILQSKLPEKVYWLNALDPASLCGVQVEAVKRDLPKRIASNHLVYHGLRLAAVSQRNGSDLTFNVPPDDPHLAEYLGFLRHLLTRQFQPLHRINVKTINGDPAAQSPYLTALQISFNAIVEGDNVVLYRKIGGASQG